MTKKLVVMSIMIMAVILNGMELKLKDLKDHVQDMIAREKDTYKFALSNFKKDGLVELLLACQGDPVQSGGGIKKYKGYGWGFMF